MPWIVIPPIVAMQIAVMLVFLKMNWLGIGPMFANLVGFTILALVLSKKFIKRQTRTRSLLNFRTIVITISLLFCSITSNLLLQMGQKHLLGRVWVGDASKEAYEKQNGKVERVLGEQLTERQAETLSVVQRIVQEAVQVLEEEVVFRWLFLGALLLVLPAHWAIVVSSLIFAGMHLVYPIAISDPQLGLTRLLPTFVLGVFCGVAYLKYGLPASFLIHFAGNLIRVFAFGEYDFLVDWIIWGSAFCALVLLAPTLWFTRQRPHSLLSQGLKGPAAILFSEK